MRRRNDSLGIGHMHLMWSGEECVERYRYSTAKPWWVTAGMGWAQASPSTAVDHVADRWNDSRLDSGAYLCAHREKIGGCTRPCVFSVYESRHTPQIGSATHRVITRHTRWTFDTLMCSPSLCVSIVYVFDTSDVSNISNTRHRATRGSHKYSLR